MVWKKQAKINHKKIKDLSWCTNCVMMSTRPRMTFNEDGLCNACQWSFEKNKKINWSVRKKALLAHETQVDPKSPFWFGLPDEVAREVHPYDDYILALSEVDTKNEKGYEDDLFAGIEK